MVCGALTRGVKIDEEYLYDLLKILRWKSGEGNEHRKITDRMAVGTSWNESIGPFTVRFWVVRFGFVERRGSC
jgi:hypothetical protein